MAKKIVVADDEPSILLMVENRLKANGFEVVTAADGAQALAAIKQHKPDLAILDIMMPPPNGYQVCRMIKDDPALKKTPVILLTARGSQSDRFWGTESGADAYITKPYDPKELMETVSRLLEA